MIGELLLTCALAMPALPYRQESLVPYGLFFSQLLVNYIPEGLEPDPILKKALLVDGDPNRVQVMRNQGLKAFGAFTTDWPYISKWHAAADIRRLPFPYDAFDLILYLHPNPLLIPAYGLITEVEPLLKRGGYLGFNDEQYPEWLPLLSIWNWKQLVDRYQGLVIYQKPNTRGSYHENRAIQSAA